MRMMMRRKFFIIRIFRTLMAVVAAILLASCSASRFLKDGESFYTGAKVVVVSPNHLPGEKKEIEILQKLITPRPNKRILGSRPAVWFYFIAGKPKKERGFRHFIKTKLGTPPVLMTSVTPEKTALNLENQLNNDGYFRSTVRHEVITKPHERRVAYRVTLQPQYRLGKVDYLIIDTTTSRLRKNLTANSLLQTGQPYQLEKLEAEQLRIENVLTNLGYFYFDDRYLLFIGDSTVGNHSIDLELKYERGIPARAIQSYRLKTVTVYPDYSLYSDSITAKSPASLINRFIYVNSRDLFRPEIITNVINLEPDSIYRRTHHDLTLTRLMSLKVFKYVDIKYSNDRLDSSMLHAQIYLTPLLRNSIHLQVQLTSKSNNFLGPGIELIFLNRNLFKGAEIFQLKLNTAYESQISRQQTGALNSLEFGVEANLTVPRFIPLRIRYRSARYVPQTQFKLSYNIQQRLQYFSLTSFHAAYGFVWRETMMKTHELFPIEISYVQSRNTSAQFEQLLLQNPTLSNSFQNQFIIGSRYSFTLNTQLRDGSQNRNTDKELTKHNFYLFVSVDFSGNALHALQSLNKEKEEPFFVFRTLYSQYVKGDLDFRYYWQWNRHSKVATRFAGGLGYALGNSSTLPYLKQFSIGGSNSIRAFPARTIGPGTYSVLTDGTAVTNRTFIDQRADIKLEANAEFRFDIINAVKGAIFLDAGNIWLMKEDEQRPGGSFNSDTFLDELAVGTGVGIRYDFSFFVLRLDLAMPLRRPNLEKDQRWVVDDVDFTSGDWRRKNLIFNIAIGYPF